MQRTVSDHVLYCKCHKYALKHISLTIYIVFYSVPVVLYTSKKSLLTSIFPEYFPVETYNMVQLLTISVNTKV